MRPVNRALPKLPAQHMKTYQVAAPLATHWRPATCAEVGCVHYLQGWVTVIEKLVDTDGQLEATVRRSGRRFSRELREHTKVTFIFEAGQPCFKAALHKLPLEREALYLVKDGDWRGNPRGTKALQHKRPELWIEDFAEHQSRISAAIEKG